MLVKALPAEVVALGVLIRDITRDGSWMVGNWSWLFGWLAILNWRVARHSTAFARM